MTGTLMPKERMSGSQYVGKRSKDEGWAIE
jgi:hypothetical protein